MRRINWKKKPSIQESSVTTTHLHNCFHFLHIRGSQQHPPGAFTLKVFLSCHSCLRLICLSSFAFPCAKYFFLLCVSSPLFQRIIRKLLYKYCPSFFPLCLSLVVRIWRLCLCWITIAHFSVYQHVFLCLGLFVYTFHIFKIMLPNLALLTSLNLHCIDFQCLCNYCKQMEWVQNTSAMTEYFGSKTSRWPSPVGIGCV